MLLPSNYSEMFESLPNLYHLFAYRHVTSKDKLPVMCDFDMKFVPVKYDCNLSLIIGHDHTTRTVT